MTGSSQNNPTGGRPKTNYARNLLSVHLRGLKKIIANEERQQDHVRLQLQSLVDEDCQVFSGADSGNPHVDQFERHIARFQFFFNHGEIVKRIRDNADRRVPGREMYPAPF